MKLTLEHIIPAALKGYMKLPESACHICRPITQRFEASAIRKVFGDARIHLGMGWKTKSEQPTTGRVEVDRGNGKEVLYVPYSEHPFVMMLPDFQPPRILERTSGPPKWRLWMRNIQSDTQSRIDRLGGRVSMEQRIPVNDFCRMLAKIAHSYAVATLGHDYFLPELPKVILGQPQHEILDWVGGVDEFTPADTSEHELPPLHNIYLTKAWRPGVDYGRPGIIAVVQLFAMLNTPRYQAIVGKTRLPEHRLQQV